MFTAPDPTRLALPRRTISSCFTYQLTSCRLQNAYTLMRFNEVGIKSIYWMT